MTGHPHVKFVADRRYLDPAIAMARILELANAAEADKGRISIGPISRTLLDEGASVDEYTAGLQRDRRRPAQAAPEPRQCDVHAGRRRAVRVSAEVDRGRRGTKGQP